MASHPLGQDAQATSRGRPARALQEPPARSGPLAGAYSPSITLPLRFVLTAVLALATGVIWLAARPDVLATYHYNQYVIALTHLFVLGWITTLIMGAMYQLVPVALETRLHSERLAGWQFGLHVLGFAGMVAMFWVWNPKQAGHFGSVLALGAGLFAYNIGRTLWRVPRWNVVAGGIASAVVWFCLTVCAGLYVVAAKCWSFSPFQPLAQMHAHAHLGGVGFFLMMIVAVSYKLVPMFALSELQSPRRAWWSVGLLNAGLLGATVTVLLQSPWKLAFTLLTLMGLAVYGVEMAAILRARKRRHLDWGLKYFLTALGFLAPLSALAVVLAWPGLPATTFTTQLENVYGFLALMGVVTFAILGMLYKIVPFLVWYGRYSRDIGRRPVPTLADLYSGSWQVLGYWTYLAAVLAVSASTAFGHTVAVGWSCAVLAASVLVFLANLVKMLRHLLRPQVEPPPAGSAATPNT
jgi:hypothetical protein